MKVKNIINLCKKRKHFIIFNEPDCQWLSDGSGAYPLAGLPKLDEDVICHMYDINDSQREKTQFTYSNSLAEIYNYFDTDEDETPTEISEISIIDDGITLLPVVTEQGLMLIDNKYLAPFSDSRKDELELYLRINSAAEPFFVVKKGLLMYGIVMPRKVDERFVSRLETIYRLSKANFENGKNG